MLLGDDQTLLEARLRLLKDDPALLGTNPQPLGVG
jgi:hypothetical protein